jgi:hypothetical protein
MANKEANSKQYVPQIGLIVNFSHTPLSSPSIETIPTFPNDRRYNQWWVRFPTWNLHGTVHYWRGGDPFLVSPGAPETNNNLVRKVSAV